MVEKPTKVEKEEEKELKESVKESVEKVKEGLKEGKGMVYPSPPKPDFINASRYRFVDISTELFREYIYANGAKLRVDFPLYLSIAENNAHRLFDSSGLSYYIPPNWLSIVWKAKEGAPNFIF